MRYMLAFFVPGIALISMGKVFQGIICLLLQITVIGWLPAAFWAFGATKNYYEDRRFDRLGNAFERGAQARIS